MTYNAKFITQPLRAVALAALMAAAGVALSPAHAAGPQGRIVTVEATPSIGQRVGGTVVPFKVVTLTAQVNGRVVQVAGEVGEGFQDGAVLAAINDARFMAQRQAAMAELRTADAALREAQMQYSREIHSPQSQNIGMAPGFGVPSLFDQMFTRPAGQMMGYGNPWVDRQADLYSRHTGIDQAMARVHQARSRLDELDTMIRDTRSIAPFDGMIMAKHVEEGDTVQPGQPLITFGHTRFLRIEAHVPARLVERLQLGMLIPVVLDVGRTEVLARVAQIYPLADPERHTVLVKFDLPQGVPGGPGMYVDLQLPGAGREGGALTVPASAIIPGASLPRVAVVDAKGEAQIRMVRLGGEEAGRVVVLSGLSEGERLLDEPPASIRSGQPVGGQR